MNEKIAKINFESLNLSEKEKRMLIRFKEEIPVGIAS